MKGVFVLLVSISLVASGACRRRTADVAGYRDPHPPPAEPRIEDLPSVGKYGGRIVVAETVEPKSFNAMMANESSTSNITERSFVQLTDYDNVKQEITPGLAKSWSVAPDGVTWTFNLRKGAAFSDGHPITAADVLFSFAVAYDEKLHPPMQDLIKMGGKPFEVSAPDPFTVVVKTPAPSAALVDSVSNVPIMPKHILEGAFKDGTFASAYNVGTPVDKIITSGKWRVTQYVAGEKTVLGRNPYWFGFDQQNQRLPYLDEVVFIVVPDQDAADLKFRAGELDGVDNVKPENFRWYEDNQEKGRFTLHDLGPDMNTNHFWFNLNRVHKSTPGKKLGDPYVDPVKYSWFKNPMFRRAVSMAIDRDAMLPSIFFGNGYKNWAVATPANKLWHSPDLVHYDHNPDEARKLLASLGMTDRNGDGVVEDSRGHAVSFTMKTNSDNTMRVGMANFIKDDLAKIGIKLTLVPVDFNTLITNIQADFHYDLILLGLQSGVPPDPSMMQNVWRSSGFTHFWHLAQPTPDTPEEARVDQLMDIIVTNQDLAARKQAYKEVETICNEQGWFIWLPIRRQKIPISNRFGNIQPSILRHRILWNADQIYVK